MNVQVKLQPKQKEAARFWNDQTTEEILYGGGKGGGKSFVGSTLIAIDCLLYPGVHTFIGRENLTDLVKYTTPSILEAVEKMGINPLQYLRFDAQKNLFKFYNGSKIYYIDCQYQPRDPDYHRFGSLQFTRGWLEEIGQINTKAIIALSGTVGRWKNKDYNLKRKTLYTCNPYKGFGYSEFYLLQKNSVLPDFRKFIHALPKDNIYLPPDYLNALSRLPAAERQRLLYGDWDYDTNPDAMISGEDVENLFTNRYVPEGERYIIADIARYGSDRAIITVWSGLRLIDYIIFDTSSIVDIQNAINALRMKHSVQLSNILVDQDGVGGGVMDNLRCKGFVNNSRAHDSNYFNLKSECGYKLAEIIKDIWIQCELPDKEKEMIRQELSYLMTYKSDEDGRMRIFPKEKIKEKIGRSPDWLDIFIMRMYYIVAPVHKGIRFLN